jgi:hypothetical protein
MLCDKCSNIHFKRLEDCRLIQEQPERLHGVGFDEKQGSHSLFYFHHQNGKALKSSADEGCHFCAMLWGSLFGSVGTSGSGIPFVFAREDVLLSRNILENWINQESGLEEWNSGDLIYVSCGQIRVMTKGLWKISGESKLPCLCR